MTVTNAESEQMVVERSVWRLARAAKGDSWLRRCAPQPTPPGRRDGGGPRRQDAQNDTSDPFCPVFEGTAAAGNVARFRPGLAKRLDFRVAARHKRGTMAHAGRSHAGN